MILVSGETDAMSSTTEASSLFSHFWWINTNSSTRSSSWQHIATVGRQVLHRSFPFGASSAEPKMDTVIVFRLDITKPRTKPSKMDTRPDRHILAYINIFIFIQTPAIRKKSPEPKTAQKNVFSQQKTTSRELFASHLSLWHAPCFSSLRQQPKKDKETKDG